MPRDTVFSAVFKAKEEISEAMTKASKATKGYENRLDKLQRNANLLSGSSEWLEENLDELTRQKKELASGTKLANTALEEIDDAMEKVFVKGEITEETVEGLSHAFNQADLAAESISGSIDELVRSESTLIATGQLSEAQVQQLRNAMSTAVIPAATLSRNLDSLSTSAAINAGAMNAAEQQIEDVNRDLAKTTVAAGAAGAQMSLLNAILEQSSFEFSSLSVNIGPFNVALRNILVQLPAILTGMATLVAVVSALATAFITLGATLGALFLGGAIGFYQQFSRQFEDTAEAAEVLMAALRDLFVEALEPLNTQANVDLLVDTIDWAARLVNRLAQFFNQMRGDVLSFFDGIDGNLGDFFEMLHDSFVILTPVLQDFINYFSSNLPRVMMEFVKITKRVDQNLDPLIDSFGDLFMEALNFGQLVLSALAPIIAVVVQLLSDFFEVVNSLGDTIGRTTIQALALAIAVGRVYTAVKSAIGGMQTLNAIMLTQAFRGSILARMYISLQTAALKVLRTETSLKVVMADLNKAFRAHIGAVKAATIARWGSLKSILANIAGFLGLSGAINVASGALLTFAGIATGGLYPVLLALLAIVTTLVGAIVAANWGEIKAAASDAIGFLKDALVFLARVLVSLVIPSVNAFLAMVGMIVRPLLAFGEGVGRLFGALTNTEDAVGGNVDVLGQMANIIFTLIDYFGLLYNIVAIIYEAFGDLMVAGIVKWFNVFVWAVNAVQDAFSGILEFFGVEDDFNRFISNMVKGFEMLADMIMSTDEILDYFIENLNRIPGVDIEGPRFDAAEARRQINLESTGPQDTDDIQTRANVNLSFEESLEQNIDVTADPEEKEQMRRIVQDALNESNSIARRTSGVGR